MCVLIDNLLAFAYLSRASGLLSKALATFPVSNCRPLQFRPIKIEFTKLQFSDWLGHLGSKLDEYWWEMSLHQMARCSVWVCFAYIILVNPISLKHKNSNNIFRNTLSLFNKKKLYNFYTLHKIFIIPHNVSSKTTSVHHHKETYKTLAWMCVHNLEPWTEDCKKLHPLFLWWHHWQRWRLLCVTLAMLWPCWIKPY